MRKLLDNYYLVILRFFDYSYERKDMFHYKSTGLASSIPILNLFSIVLLIAPQISIDYFMNYIWEIIIAIFIIGIVVSSILNRIYNKERRESLRERYKDESEEERQRRVTWVVLYIVLSIAFLIFAFWMFSGCVPDRGK